MVKQKVNKTKAVKDYLKVNRKAKNQEVVDALAKKGIAITANYVGNIKATHNKRGRAVRSVVAKGGIGIPDAQSGFGFAQGHKERCGSDQGPCSRSGDQADRVRPGQDD